ncbi:MAG TPA: conjugative transposon protein TraN [Chryseobacterium sp.]|nr:conjugative transposon protein TraN [Chryseobacterium sp.]
MKKLLLITATYVFICNLIAQNDNLKFQNTEQIKNSYVTDSTIVSFVIPLKSSAHLISPEPINYVDISSPDVEGDLPDKKICRIKPLPGKLKEGESFTITIVTNSFITVYKMICSDKTFATPETYVITINPVTAIPIRQENYLREDDYRRLAIHALGKKKAINNLSSSAYALDLWVNNIFIVGDFILMDIGIKNKSHLQFDIDEERFKIKDKKIISATVSQDIELQPMFTFYDEKKIVRKTWRNFYVFRKFTYPTDKVFNIEFTEKQISGRKISLDIDYNQILQADVLQ